MPEHGVESVVMPVRLLWGLFQAAISPMVMPLQIYGQAMGAQTRSDTEQTSNRELLKVQHIAINGFRQILFVPLRLSRPDADDQHRPERTAHGDSFARQRPLLEQSGAGNRSSGQAKP